MDTGCSTILVTPEVVEGTQLKLYVIIIDRVVGRISIVMEMDTIIRLGGFLVSKVGVVFGNTRTRCLVSPQQESDESCKEEYAAQTKIFMLCSMAGRGQRSGIGKEIPQR